jgi:hypothetical protein
LTLTCKALGGNQTALLAVPGKKSLDGVITSVLGEKIKKELSNNNEIILPQNLGKVVLLTERSTKTKYISGPSLVVYPTKKILDIIDSYPNITDVLVIPWHKDYDVPEWIETWHASELGHKKREVSPLIENKVIIEALKSLLISINKSTGISHPADKGATINLFKLLKKEKELFNSKEIRSWLVAEGKIDPKYADDIAKVAQNVLDGKPLRGEIPSWNSNIVKKWRENTV